MAPNPPQRGQSVPTDAPKQPPKQPQAKTPITPVGPDAPRKQAVRELIALPAIPLSMLAAVETARNPGQISPYALDCKTLDIWSEPLSDAIVQLADTYPMLGAWLDKFAQTTPFAAIAFVGMGMAFQFAENHGALPDTVRPMAPSLIDRHVLAEQLQEEAKRIRDNGIAA